MLQIRAAIYEHTAKYSELVLEQSMMWPKGTLCIAIAPNIAKMGTLTFGACLPDSVVGFTPNGKTSTEYVELWFHSILISSIWGAGTDRS